MTVRKLMVLGALVACCVQTFCVQGDVAFAKEKAPTDDKAQLAQLKQDHAQLAKDSAQLAKDNAQLAKDNAQLAKDNAQLKQDSAQLAKDNTALAWKVELTQVLADGYRKRANTAEAVLATSPWAGLAKAKADLVQARAETEAVRKDGELALRTLRADFSSTHRAMKKEMARQIAARTSGRAVLQGKLLDAMRAELIELRTDQTKGTPTQRADVRVALSSVVQRFPNAGGGTVAAHIRLSDLKTMLRLPIRSTRLAALAWVALLDVGDADTRAAAIIASIREQRPVSKDVLRRFADATLRPVLRAFESQPLPAGFEALATEMIELAGGSVVQDVHTLLEDEAQRPVSSDVARAAKSIWQRLYAVALAKK